MIMKFVVAAFLLAAVLVTSSARVSPVFSDWYELAKPQLKLGDIWSDCSPADDKTRLKINAVNITPNPPKKGQNLQVIANITLLEKIDGGDINIAISFDKIPFITLHYKVCDEAPLANLQCPIAAGLQVLKVNEVIPDEAPSGNYSGKVTITDQNSKELVCVVLDFLL